MPWCLQLRHSSRGADLLPCNPAIFREQVQPVSQDVPAQALMPLPDQELQPDLISKQTIQ